ncbi:MAG: hypothetical protein HS099_11915 [Ardenticatenaceae bacterium]|nr:hypothetical protein [Ardenticatenaceae bacterium]
MTQQLKQLLDSSLGSHQALTEFLILLFQPFDLFTQLLHFSMDIIYTNEGHNLTF